MKKYILFLFFAIAVFIPANTHAVDAQLSERLHGHILLQVEEHGEAWYVRSTDSSRYYMKDGAAAYAMMRTFSLGITNSDLEFIPAVENITEINNAPSVCDTNALANRLRGEILLQVESKGEAWYVDPDTCRRIYMKDGETAYDIMRFLGLGITNSDLAKIATSTLTHVLCGKDLDCFVHNIQSEQGAKMTDTFYLNIFGIHLTTTSDLEHTILADGYQISQVIKDQSVSYDEELLDMLREYGYTESDIAEMKKDVEEEMENVVGQAFTCKHNDKEALVTVLQAWSLGNFTSNDLNFADCDFGEIDVFSFSEGLNIASSEIAKRK